MTKCEGCGEEVPDNAIGLHMVKPLGDNKLPDDGIKWPHVVNKKAHKRFVSNLMNAVKR